jgi:hypothetical protein
LIQGAGQQVAQFLCLEAAGRAWGRAGRGVGLGGPKGERRRRLPGPSGGGNASEQEQSRKAQGLSQKLAERKALSPPLS